MIVKAPETQFIQCPVGVHAAVCVDEIDMGKLPNRFDPESGPVPTVRLVWQIAEEMKDGKPFLIKKDYRASLHEKSGLRKELESWRGRAFTFQELAGFDLETIVGAPCMLNVVEHVSKKGASFSNIAAVMPLAKGMMKLAPRDYVRVKDREEVKEKEPAPSQSQSEPEPFGTIDDSDVPF